MADKEKKEEVKETKKKITGPTAKIGLTTYGVDSDNTKLLDVLEKARRDKEKQKMVDVPFLPIEIVYQLLEQMFPKYDIDSPSMVIDKSFKVSKKKKDRNTKKTVEYTEEVFLCTKTVTLYLGGKHSTEGRILQGEAKGVATIGQITSDQMYNGFNMKQEARAVKNALKKVGRVFRINDDIEDVIEKQGIKEDLSTDTTVSSFDDLLGTVTPVSGGSTPPPSELEEKIIIALKNHLEGKGPVDNKAYMDVAKAVKEELGIEDGTDQKDLMVKVVKEFKALYVK